MVVYYLEIDECSFGFCPPEAQCLDGINSFTCVCPDSGCDEPPTQQPAEDDYHYEDVQQQEY